MTDNEIEKIAKICHDTNRSFCESIGDFSQLPWEISPLWQQESAIAGVKFVIENPAAYASANHDSWMAEKETNGWKYGPVKDPEKKEHPCMVPYNELPEAQRRKDYLFKAVVEALTCKIK